MISLTIIVQGIPKPLEHPNYDNVSNANGLYWSCTSVHY
nr:MAG TPA: hypothetical protein [Caudoviricetes sp.]DAY38407.1 MAG TPA: hypothetical protein [Bacteriophage sp.]